MTTPTSEAHTVPPRRLLTTQIAARMLPVRARRRWNRLRLVFAGVAVIALLAACSGGGADSPTDGAAVTSTDATVGTAAAPPDAATTGPLGAAAAASQTTIADDRLAVLDNVDRPPPIASLITVGSPALDGTTTVSGAPGAVPPRAAVLVASVAYSAPALVGAADDGSFDVEILSAPGDTIQVRYRAAEDFDPSEPKFLFRTNHWPGTFVRAPSEPGSDFSGAYYLNVEGGLLRGFASGTITEIILASGGSTDVAGTVAFRIPPGAAVPSVVSYSAGAWLAPLFDADGNQIGAGTDFISHLLTPTGLPIERSVTPGNSTLGHLQVSSLERVGDLMIGSFDGNVVIQSMLPDGTYRLMLEFSAPDLGGLGVRTFNGPISLTQNTDGFVPVAVVTVGEPAPPRLAPMLLTDSPSQGQRGTVAREDYQRIAFANRIVSPSPRLIIPPGDLGSGDLIQYRLEPFLPFVSMADRRISQEPAIPFDLPGGQLTVTVVRPGGQTEELGTHEIQQARTGHATSSTGTLLVDGGGNPGSVYQLTTLSDDFVYQFDEYGRYEIRLSGSVPDVWGNSYSLDSVFDVWVAETLDLEPSSLPSTPFEVGDKLPAILTVFPGVPAAIEWEVAVHPIDGSDPVARSITGTANRFGYFGVAEAFSFEVAGEYLSTIHASYTDSEGRLWMATRAWGSGIATPDGALIAHGRRGIDEQPAEERAAWFTRFSTAIPDSGSSHISFPYHSGDIMWMLDSDATQPRISVQDTVGVIQGLIEDRLNKTSFEDDPALRISLEELPLGISSSTDVEPTIDPGAIDQWAYAYRAVERPGVRVRETIGTDRTNSAYWRFQDMYLLQWGMGSQGELPNDLKWQFGAAVFKRADLDIGEVAIYASQWVEVPDTDPLGSRVFPPFQGAAGGPSGGPIMTLQGQEIDLFLLPTTVHPGAVLELGDQFVFAGQVGPPLASKVTYTITSPSGATFGGAGQANAIGYYSDPEGGFSVDEPGIWIVQVDVLHDGETSAGPVEAPFPTGGVLGSDDGTYNFFVVDAAAPTLDAGLGPFSIAELGLGDQAGCINSPDCPVIEAINFLLDVPTGWSDVEAAYVIRMPGFILETGRFAPANGKAGVIYDPVRLSADFPNIDLHSRQDQVMGLADEIMITVFLTGRDASGAPVYAAKLLTLVGEDIYNLN